jgi:hypothetical protein
MTTTEHFDDDLFANALRAALSHRAEIPGVFRTAVDGLRAHRLAAAALWPPNQEHSSFAAQSQVAAVESVLGEMKRSLIRIYQLAAGQHQRLLGRAVLVPAEHDPHALAVIRDDPAASGWWGLRSSLIRDDYELMSLLDAEDQPVFDGNRHFILGRWEAGALLPDYFLLDDVRRLTREMAFSQKRAGGQHRLAEQGRPAELRIAALEEEVRRLRAKADPERN